MAVGITEVRMHVETDLPDGALGRLVDDATAEVEGRFGTDTAKTVYLIGGGYVYLHLLRPAQAITAVTERDSHNHLVVVLAANDYLLVNGGRMLERLQSGTTPASSWSQRVEVTYTPTVELPMRDRLVIDLVQLAVHYSGMESERIGDYSTTSGSYLLAREQILMGGASHRGFRFA